MQIWQPQIFTIYKQINAENFPMSPLMVAVAGLRLSQTRKR